MIPPTQLDLEKLVWTVHPEKNKVRTQILSPIVRPLIPEVVPMFKKAIILYHSKSSLFTQS